jgi:hypothetical protein
MGLAGKPEVNTENVCGYRRIILKCIFKKYDERLQIKLVWPRIWTNDRLL